MSPMEIKIQIEVEEGEDISMSPYIIVRGRMKILMMSFKEYRGLRGPHYTILEEALKRLLVSPNILGQG
jgi:hypothetical protein